MHDLHVIERAYMIPPARVPRGMHDPIVQHRIACHI